MDGHWQVDNPDVLQSQDNVVSCGDTAPGGEKYNAMWMHNTTSVADQQVWEFRVENSEYRGETWIGFTMESKFSSGWSCRSLSFGGPGNLSDGLGLLRSDYGPALGTGDLVRMTVQISTEGMQISYAVNEKPLGVAFNIDGPLPSGNWYPVVSFSSKNCSVAIQHVVTPVTVPTVPSTSSGERETIFGSWQVPATSIISDAESRDSFVRLILAPRDENPNIGMVTVSGDSSLRINTLTTEIVYHNGRWKSTGNVSSTKMMVEGSSARVESALFELIRSIEQLTVRGSRELLATTKTGAEYVFTAENTGTKAVVRSEVRWLN